MYCWGHSSFTNTSCYHPVLLVNIQLRVYVKVCFQLFSSFRGYPQVTVIKKMCYRVYLLMNKNTGNNTPILQLSHVT